MERLSLDNKCQAEADDTPCRLCLNGQSLVPASATLASIGNINTLTELDLSRTTCEEGADFDGLLISLRGLKYLQRLNLSSTAVHSKGLEAIGSMAVSLPLMSLHSWKRRFSSIDLTSRQISLTNFSASFMFFGHLLETPDPFSRENLWNALNFWILTFVLYLAHHLHSQYFIQKVLPHSSFLPGLELCEDVRIGNLCLEILKVSFFALQELTSLDLSCTSLEEDSLVNLRSLHKLRELFLEDRRWQSCISDAGMAHLSSLLSLERLSLRFNVHVSNAGLKYLLQLPHLAYLDFRGCRRIHNETALRQLQVERNLPLEKLTASSHYRTVLTAIQAEEFAWTSQ